MMSGPDKAGWDAELKHLSDAPEAKAEFERRKAWLVGTMFAGPFLIVPPLWLAGVVLPGMAQFYLLPLLILTYIVVATRARRRMAQFRCPRCGGRWFHFWNPQAIWSFDRCRSCNLPSV